MSDQRTLHWRCRDRHLEVGDRPLLMGILNVTPDSFYDGGRHFAVDKAVMHGLGMVEEGAAIIDVGGESTRPGAEEIDPAEEMRRVIPVVQELRRATKAVISIDTRKALVAQRALEVGADIINDVSAMTHDPEMLVVARRYNAGVILMHMQGTPRTMQENPVYTDVVKDVCDYLAHRIEAATAAGLLRETLALDPGIGFGKTLEHNLSLLANLDKLLAMGLPVVVGLSRKSFIGRITGRPVEERLAGSLVALVFCLLQGVHILRVHDVRESHDAVEVASALRRGRVNSQCHTG